MKPIFAYTNYREYLGEFYQEKKGNSRFSYREFSRIAGFTSPVFIKLVIEGKSNLAKNSALKLAKAMGLVETESRYFLKLVIFNQEKSLGQKLLHLEELKSLTSSLHVEPLGADQTEFFQEWRHGAIRELLNLIQYQDNERELAGLIRKRIKPKEVVQSIELLRDLKLIRPVAGGGWEPTENFITSNGADIPGLAVRAVQRQMAVLAGEALDEVVKAERDISGLTLGISPEAFNQICEELKRTRQRILEIAAQDERSDRVYRLNLQLFPLTNRIPEERLKRKKKQKFGVTDAN